MTTAEPKIAIRNVSFDYVNEKKAYPALQNVSLEIRGMPALFLKEALKLLDARGQEGKRADSPDELVYYAMIEVSGPTVEQKVGNLSGDTLKHALKKGTDFGALSDWDTKFLKSIAAQKKRGKVLSEKQINSLTRILSKLVDNDVIKHDSIDGDQDICDEILEALER